MGAVKPEEAAAATEQARSCCCASKKNKKQERAEMAVAAEEDDSSRELIPGLPDDVAIECLARVPSPSHCPMRRVCRGWRGTVGSPEFRRLRRLAGAEEDLVLLVQASPPGGGGGDGEGGNNKAAYAAPQCALAVANLTTGEWRRVEGDADTWDPVPLFAQCAAAGDGHHVAVVGGWDPDTLRPTAEVRVLDVGAGAWRRGAPMPDARSFFGCCAGGGEVVYVAGGHDACKNALRSALAYDVAADAWRALTDMAEERDEPQLVAVAGGRVLAASGYATEAQGAFKRTAESYAPGDGAWAYDVVVVPDDAGTAACQLASVRGSVWAVGAGKGGVREWDGAARAWRGVADGPPGMKACVKAVGVSDADVFVFGAVDDDAAEGTRYAAWVMDAAGATWRRVPVPRGVDGFVYSAAAVRV